MELLQTELSDSKQEVERLKSQLLKLKEYNVIIETQLRVSYNFKCFIILVQMETDSFANENC